MWKFCKFELVFRSCHSQGKLLENDFFPGKGKVSEFSGWAGKSGKDLKGQGKVREFSGLGREIWKGLERSGKSQEIRKFVATSLFRKYTYSFCSRGKY